MYLQQALQPLQGTSWGRLCAEPRAHLADPHPWMYPGPRSWRHLCGWLLFFVGKVSLSIRAVLGRGCKEAPTLYLHRPQSGASLRFVPWSLSCHTQAQVLFSLSFPSHHPSIPPFNHPPIYPFSGQPPSVIYPLIYSLIHPTSVHPSTHPTSIHPSIPL